MKLIIDIEANGLEAPDKIWCIVTKDVDTGEVHVYRQETLEEFKALCLAQKPTLIGHFILGYDLPVLNRLLGIPIDVSNCFDTAIISKLVDYSRPQGHAIEDYGLEFGLEKIKFSDFSKWSQEMEDYCVRDVEIGYLVYNRFKRIISDPVWRPSILLEQRFQLIVNDLHDNGFAFNTKKATQLLEKVTKELAKLDEAILKEFPPKLKPIREIHPKETKHGTLNRSDFRWVTDGDLSCYNGGPFTRCSWSSFNPSSHKQIIEVLNKAGWSPVNKTQTHIDKEREYNRLKYTRNKDPGVDLRLKVLYDGLQLAKSTGWKVDETNLATLPDTSSLELWINKQWLEIPLDTLNIINNGVKITESILESTPKHTIEKINVLSEIDNYKEITEFLLKTLKSFPLNKKDVAEFVEKTSPSWLIIATRQGVYADCSANNVMSTWSGILNFQSLQQDIFRIKAAKTLARRILFEARRRSLTEWINLVCFEIKIEKENIDVLGHAIKEQMILNGVPRNKNITDKDVEKEILKSLENLYCKNLDIIHKKNVKDDTILSIPTDLLWKSLISWLKLKKVNVRFVEEKSDCVLITITAPEKSEGFYAKDAIPLLDGLKKIGLQYKIISERIKGQFFGIGAWTHRMAHQKPNTANIPREFTEDGSVKLLGKEMRQLWIAPKNKLLVGVDAEGIQLRIFAHYIQDEEFTDALVRGRKSDKTDPHSLNQRILGSNCKSRQAAKRFIYALLLGAGIEKLAQILGCSKQEAEEALARLLDRYQGFAELKEKYIPADARRGYFIGLDGRKVQIPGETEGSRKHLCMSGYLQNGEAIVVKRAAIIADDTIKSDAQLKGLWKFVNIVHDELQSETKNDMAIAKRVAQIKADAIKSAGEELKLRCPMAGSYFNDDINDYTIGTNWYQTH